MNHVRGSRIDLQLFFCLLALPTFSCLPYLSRPPTAHSLLQCDTLSSRPLSAQWHVNRLNSDSHLSTNLLNPFEVSVSIDACKLYPMDTCVLIKMTYSKSKHFHVKHVFWVYTGETNSRYCVFCVLSIKLKTK